MKKLTLILAACFLLSGCTMYSERFTYFDSETGATNHIVHVSHHTFMTYGKAAKLSTETQTMEFIRTVNAEGLSQRPDAESEFVACASCD